jgi:hypothetical protein
VEYVGDLQATSFIRDILKARPIGQPLELEQLSLSYLPMGFDSENYLRSEHRLADLLSRHIVFDLLTHLTLDTCEDWEVLLGLIVEQHIRAREPIKLKHFALCIQEDVTPIVSGDLADRGLHNSLAPFLELCTSMESLCLQWYPSWYSPSDQEYRIRNPDSVLAKVLPKIGRTLRVLSLSTTLSEAHYDVPTRCTLSQETFKIVCESCPNLQQLGCQIGGYGANMDASDPTEENDEDYMMKIDTLVSLQGSGAPGLHCSHVILFSNKR